MCVCVCVGVSLQMRAGMTRLSTGVAPVSNLQILHNSQSACTCTRPGIGRNASCAMSDWGAGGSSCLHYPFSLMWFLDVGTMYMYASCAFSDWLTSGPGGCSQPRELWFSGICMYMCMYMNAQFVFLCINPCIYHRRRGHSAMVFQSIIVVL